MVMSYFFFAETLAAIRPILRAAVFFLMMFVLANFAILD